MLIDAWHKPPEYTAACNSAALSARQRAACAPGCVRITLIHRHLAVFLKGRSGRSNMPGRRGSAVFGWIDSCCARSMGAGTCTVYARRPKSLGRAHKRRVEDLIARKLMAAPGLRRLKSEKRRAGQSLMPSRP